MSKPPPQSATVVALFTGRSQTVAIHDLPEPTSYVRRRSNVPLAVGPHGLEGDTLGTPRRLGQINHALYLMAQEHYLAHSDRLGRPVPQGGFSENVLYAGGPSETELRIGDRLRLGNAEIIAVSPRVPCYKMTHFLCADQGYPAAFSASGRTGFYARVAVPGTVAAGAALVVLSSDTRNATMAALNHALTDPVPDPQTVAAVLASPALLPDMARTIAERFELLRPELAVGHVISRIVTHHRIAPGIARIGIEVPPDTPAYSWTWQAGQFVTLGPAGEAAGPDRVGALRCYSLIDGPRQAGGGGSFVIAVRRDGASADRSVSSWLVDEACVGDPIVLYPPTGQFVLHEGDGPVLLIGGGIGMTPILSLFKALADRDHAAQVELVQVARGPDELIFSDELTAALARLSCGGVLRHVTRHHGGGAVADDLEAPLTGRPALRAVMADMAPETQVYVCGPAGMIAEAEAAHRALGRAPALFHSEAFTPPDVGVTAARVDLSPAEVRLAGHGELGVWSPSDGPLLGWLEARLERRLPASCRSGLCRTCAAGLVRGRLAYPPGIATPQDGVALLCCARPDGDVELALPVSVTSAAQEKAADCFGNVQPEPCRNETGAR